MDASTTTTEEGKEWKELKTAANGGPTSVTMYRYKYPGSITLSTSVIKADSSYWLPSRSQSFDSKYVYCGARTVYPSGTVGGDVLYQTIWGGAWEKKGVRPVVYLKSDIQLEYDAETGYTIK